MCTECDRVYKVVIECSRRATSAQSRLESFVPEPPFGNAARSDLHDRQLEAEKSRTALAHAERERTEHLQTHLLTLS